MAKESLHSELRSRIDVFLNDVTEMIRRHALDSVHAVLGEGGAAPGRRRGRPPGSGAKPQTAPVGARRGKRIRRSGEEVDAIAQRVATYVRAHPGQGLIEIAKGLGVSTDVLKLPVMKLMAAKQLKTTGQKRGTKYFAGGRGGPRKATRAKPRKKHGKKRGRKGRRSKR